MKKVILGGVALLFSFISHAQDFPTQWKSKFSFKAERWFYDEQGKYVMGRTDEEAEVLDGNSGKSLWKLNYKNDLKVKTIDRASYNEGEGLVLLYNADDKKKNGEKIVVDLATGKELWRGDAYSGEDADGNYHFAHCLSSITSKGTMMVFNNTTKKFTGIDLRSGKVKWESPAFSGNELEKNIIINPIEDSEFAQVILYNEDDLLKNKVLFLSIVTGEELKDNSRFSSSTGDYERYSSGKVKVRKTIDGSEFTLVGTMKNVGFNVKYELTASGAVTWKKEFESNAVRQLWNDAPYVKMDIQGDKIFVIAKKIHVFDIKTGKELWNAPFDNCDASAGLKAKQEFGIAGWPLVNGEDIYYVDLKEDNAIKKVNGKTGAVIWKSEKLKSNDRVPNLVLVDGVLVAQFGGLINTQIFIPNSSGGIGDGRYKTENRFDGNYEVRGYDPGTGKVIWKTTDLAAQLGDKFKERISTIYPINNKVVFATGDNLFSLEPKTGKMLYKTPLTDAKLGNMFEVLVAEDFETLYVFMDNGIAAINGTNGKRTYAVKTGEIFWKTPGSATYKFDQGKNSFIWVGEADFVGFDFVKGEVKGKMEDNNDPQFTADGNTIFVRDGEKVTRYAVNK